MDYKKLLDAIMNIGKEMLVCGAEVNRVEDTITRICYAYDITEVDVFTITSSIITTIKVKNEIYTQTKRILNYGTNLDRLDKLNSLSREICSQKPSLSYIKDCYNNIINSPKYSFGTYCIIYALIASSLTIYLGGHIYDGIVSGMLGIIMYLLINKSESIGVNITFLTILIAFIIGTLAVISVKIGFGSDLDNIVTGNIMLMIPGVAITNSIRDMINGDTMSGVLRFSESIIKAAAVAIGFVIATVYFGGMVL